MKNLVFLIKIIIAFILLQTLYFKFTAHPDSVFIFSQLGLEPYGRISIGVMELITAFMIFIHRTEIIAIFLIIGLMAGAIFSHITKLGVVVNNDGGLLFSLAFIVMVLSVLLLWIKRKKMENLFKKLGLDFMKA